MVSTVLVFVRLVFCIFRPGAELARTLSSNTQGIWQFLIVGIFKFFSSLSILIPNIKSPSLQSSSATSLYFLKLVRKLNRREKKKENIQLFPSRRLLWSNQFLPLLPKTMFAISFPITPSGRASALLCFYTQASIWPWKQNKAIFPTTWQVSPVFLN